MLFNLEVLQSGNILCNYNCAVNVVHTAKLYMSCCVDWHYNAGAEMYIVCIFVVSFIVSVNYFSVTVIFP